MADPVDTANDESVALNIGGETFYWSAEAAIDIAAPIPNPPDTPRTDGQALLVLAIEAAFANEEPKDGEQVVFARLRIRIDAAIAGVYRVIHPYGAEEFIVDVPGRRAINATRDLGGFELPADFTLALFGRIGPFLTWDPLTDAPAGFIGDPNFPHVVTGSPLGQNFFRVEGPADSNLDGNGNDFVETDLFTVQGRIASTAPPAATATSFARNAVGTGTISAVAVGPAGATVAEAVSGDTLFPLPGEPIALVPVANQAGVFTFTILIPARIPLPDAVEITFRDAPEGNVLATETVNLTDRVSVATATFDPANSTLTITAASSDLFGLPVLTVNELVPAVQAAAVRALAFQVTTQETQETTIGRVLGTVDTGSTNTLVITGVDQAPNSVQITSSEGGSAVVAVTTLQDGAGTDDPGTPGNPADPGNPGTQPTGNATFSASGGGGSCFIGALFE